MEQVNPEKITILAQTNFRNESRRFGIKKDDRRRHVYLIGKTGMGKSTTLENMIIQDIKNGEGCAVVDPHGDLAETILKYVPSNRINDVIYFNPSDVNFPIAFNVMEAATPEQKHLISSGLIAVFHKLWADSWGPRLEYLLRNSILSLLDYPGSTLLGVTRMLVDKNYRNKVVEKIQDPVVKAFWVDEYTKYSNQFQVEAISPIQNKIGQFLSIPMIRNIVGQTKSTIDLRDIMDNKKIFILNLAKGRLGEDASALLGAMMITKLQLAAMSRVDIKEITRQDFYLYVDEFQNFATESFANILSEARKYRLDLIIAHQYIEQLDEKVAAAVFGNVGTLMVFRIGAADAEFLAQEFAPHFTEEDLVNLAKYNVYMKLMIDGVSSNPFSATTCPPLFEQEPNAQDNLEKIVKVSRERYGEERLVIEDKIARWSGMTIERREDKKEPKPIINQPVTTIAATTAGIMTTEAKLDDFKKTKKKKKRPGDKKYTVNCYECGKTTQISFVPDGIRPVYCDDCFRKIRSGEKPEITSVQTQAEIKQPEISLEQALSQQPVSFKEGKPVADHKPANQLNKSNSSPNGNNSYEQSVQPGQKIKF